VTRSQQKCTIGSGEVAITHLLSRRVRSGDRTAASARHSHLLADLRIDHRERRTHGAHPQPDPGTRHMLSRALCHMLSIR
jgi:hypothetical protein